MQHCDLRGEPNLAVLVVNKATQTPSKYAADDWAAEQERCYGYDWTVDRHGAAPGQIPAT